MQESSPKTFINFGSARLSNGKHSRYGCLQIPHTKINFWVFVSEENSQYKVIVRHMYGLTEEKVSESMASEELVIQWAEDNILSEYNSYIRSLNDYVDFIKANKIERNDGCNE